jgi:Alanine racemase
VMALRSVVALIKTIPAGSTVSYGRTFTAEKPVRVATVPVGYADGYSRSLSPRGSVLIRGRRAPILGRICMDQMMVDLSQIPEAQQGDRVTLVGIDGEDAITFEELARLVGTINYELACAVSRRVPRVYLRGGKLVGVENYLRSVDC